MSHFKPAGVPGQNLVTVELHLDELEALRLADLEGLYQEQAAGAMGISRATFGRVLDRAHQKVADALINGKILSVRGGHVATPMIRQYNCGTGVDNFPVPTGGGVGGFGRGRRGRRHGRGPGPG